MSETQELDRKDLKIMGLQQRLQELDNKYLELQVDYTIAIQQLQQRAEQDAQDAEASKPEASDDAETPEVL